MSVSGVQPGSPQGGFHTTHWTQVLSARGDSPSATAALGELCGAYYGPVFVFIRASNSDEEAARDLTQEFFTRLIARHGLDTVEQGRGRFRSFLLGAVKHFLSDMRAHSRARKRGLGQATVPLGIGTDTSPGLEAAESRAPGPDLEFDRKWALTVLDRAHAALVREHADNGKSSQLEALKPWLAGGDENVSQVEAAKKMGISAGAFKVAVHRLRRRFRELVKAEIANTVPDPAQVDQELQHLLEVLS